jgi:hypothetical protein
VIPRSLVGIPVQHRTSIAHRSRTKTQPLLLLSTAVEILPILHNWLHASSQAVYSLSPYQYQSGALVNLSSSLQNSPKTASRQDSHALLD